MVANCSRLIGGLLWLATLSSVTACALPTQVAPDFTSAVARHLESVESKNFEVFKSTLTETNDLYVVFPGGGTLANTAAVLDFHKEWFQDSNWVFDTQIVKVIEGTTQSTALVKYEFRDTVDGPARQAWLVLTFQLEGNQWRLIHDQNTCVVV